MIKNILLILFIILFLFMIIRFFFKYKFNKYFYTKVEKLFELSEDISNQKVNFENLKSLPGPVRKYFRYSLTDGIHYISSVRMKHEGEFKMGKDKGWVPIKGRQYYTSEPPGFVWKGDIRFASAIDSYIDGEGRLMAKAFSIFKVIDLKSDKMNEAEFMRWLTEAVLFPTALLPSRNIKWEYIDQSSAKLIYKNNGNAPECKVFFNDKNQITEFKSKRYDGEKIKTWGGIVSNYKRINNMMIPTQIEAYWEKNDKKSRYAKFSITEIDYNTTKLF
ncbi:MAG: hypothetical protein FXF47_03020 [Candidatus Mcinerneyibacterium aminivorans]|uniref:Uncharacterized protein n=1 Tax=Candidatus Mcinerneyibacterium aminivorans TaxID=2703815 RepID=A0A5D0MGP4_9BACT|nr:MAG: hypothetical protein FXF47_03020 [Candidatus Mcinerneyibacterium aminivorans]